MKFFLKLFHSLQQPQKDFIGLISKAATSSLVQMINKALFWSLILDLTSDITQLYQLSIVVRWVQIKDDKCNIVETFLGFVRIADSKTGSIAKTAK